MTIVSYSTSASAWLDLMIPGRDQSLPVSLEHEITIFSSADSESDAQIVEASDAGSTFDWNPTTLKSVMDHALRLARKVEELPQFMRLLGEQESRLRELRDWIGARGTQPSAACLYFSKECVLLGKWVPDLIDRAGGRAILLESGDPDVAADPRDLVAARPDVLFVGYSARSQSHEAHNSRIKKFLEHACFTGRAYLIDMSEIRTSGPSLYDLVFRLSSGLYPCIDELEGFRTELLRL